MIQLFQLFLLSFSQLYVAEQDLKVIRSLHMALPPSALILINKLQRNH